MTTLTLSSLVFAFSIKGKFESAITSTTNSRNYDYAVKLQTPTIAGGQFSPMDYYTQDENGNTSIGKSGYSNAGNDNRDYTYLQAVYMGGKDQTIPGYTVIGDIPLPGIEYDPNQVPTIDVTTRDEENPEQTKIISMPLNTAIERNYYYASMAFNHTLNHPFIDAETFVRDNYENIFKVNDDYLANLFMPFMDDDSGQKYDMFYLKDRIQTKDTIDYTVGMPAMGIASNP